MGDYKPIFHTYGWLVKVTADSPLKRKVVTWQRNFAPEIVAGARFLANFSQQQNGPIFGDLMLTFTGGKRKEFNKRTAKREERRQG